MIINIQPNKAHVFKIMLILFFSIIIMTSFISASPTITPINPNNNSALSNPNQTFTINLTDNIGLKSASLCIWDQNNTMIVSENTYWESPIMVGDITRSKDWLSQANPTSNISQLVATFTTASDIFSSPTISNGYLYIGSKGNKFYQLNASNVSQLIADYTTNEMIANTAAVSNGYVYFGSYNGTFYQLNASNVSQLIATYQTGDRISYASPAVSNGYVYIGSNDNNLYQFNASNISQPIAFFTTGNDIASSPAISNGYLYIGSQDRNLYQLNASNVSQLIANYTAYDAISSSPAVSNGYVYFGSFDNRFYQVNASNVSQLIATYITGGRIDSSPAISNGYIYIGSYDNNFYQLNASNVSQLIANYTTGGMISRSSPAISNGYVYIGSHDYNFYQLNASNVSQLIADYTAGDMIKSSPAISNGYAYISSQVTRTLYQLNASNIESIKNLISGTTNQTSFNYTFIENGEYKWDVFGCDLKENCGFSENKYILTIDDIKPSITIFYPTNTTYNHNITTLNFSIDDINLDSCWYSLNNGLTNTTFSCNTNITEITSNEGINNWTIYSNDTSGNENYNQVSFTINADIPESPPTSSGSSGSSSKSSPTDIPLSNLSSENLSLTFPLSTPSNNQTNEEIYILEIYSNEFYINNWNSVNVEIRNSLNELIIADTIEIILLNDILFNESQIDKNPTNDYNKKFKILEYTNESLIFNINVKIKDYVINESYETIMKKHSPLDKILLEVSAKLSKSAKYIKNNTLITLAGFIVFTLFIILFLSISKNKKKHK